MTTKPVGASASLQQYPSLPPPLPGGDVSKTAIQQLSKRETRALKKASYQQQQAAQQIEQSQRMLTLFEQAFAGTRLFRDLIQLIDAYGEIELDLIYPIPFPPYFSLNEKDALKPYFGDAYRTPTHLQAASKILKVAHQRAIVRQYALVSEPLIYAFEFLKSTQGKTVLELGAGRGIAALLLGFSNAKTIYVNDYDKEVLGPFAQQRDQTPPNVRSKFRVLEGNCLQGKTWKPIKDNTVDLAICGSVIHFFNPNQMKAFFKELHRKLKPGGEGIFFTDTSQGYYNFQIQEKVEELDRHLTCFKGTTFLTCDESGNRLNVVLHHMENLSEQIYKLQPARKTYVYTREAVDRWVQAPASPAYIQIESKLRKRLDMYLSSEKASNLAGKKIMMIQFEPQLFNKTSLTKLFMDNGFEVVSVFYLNGEGHVQQDPGSMTIDRIGIICRKPTNTIRKK